jgi:serine/threonine protein phosphatase PrpC
MTLELESAVATHAGSVRRVNEDAVARARVASAAGEPYTLWLVADGVGGGPAGEEASHTAVEAVVEHLARSTWTRPADALTEAYEIAGHRVHDLTATGAAATTLVAALISEVDGRVWIANVGDSRAYLVTRGALRVLTEDHSIAGAEVSAGRMTREAARTAAGRNILTRALGPRSGVEVDVFGPWRLAPGKRIVLCTDGVYGVVDETKILALASLPPRQAAEGLVAAVVAAGGRDDATACVGGCR